ncbi:hypothetical protein HanLR1_Chr04g0159151 [Helianthus annuus]|nr:hypothetical protein HanLR1_Chr04g0159151 [Helianthus annuus]
MDPALQEYAMVVNNSAYDEEDDDDSPCTVVDFSKKETKGYLNTCEEEEENSSSSFDESSETYLNEHVTSFDESCSQSSVDVNREKNEVEGEEKLEDQGSIGVSGV